jgi:20S proteasome subunit beta 4
VCVARSDPDLAWVSAGSDSGRFCWRRVQFTEFIQKNLHLYQFRNTIPLSTAAAANFTRGELATALRKVPIRINLVPLFALLGLPAKRSVF